jgi:hypothetical protein
VKVLPSRMAVMRGVHPRLSCASTSAPLSASACSTSNSGTCRPAGQAGGVGYDSNGWVVG